MWWAAGEAWFRSFRSRLPTAGLTITHTEVERFLMTIPEAVRLVIQAGVLGPAGGVPVLQMGDPVSIQNLARDVTDQTLRSAARKRHRDQNHSSGQRREDDGGLDGR